MSAEMVPTIIDCQMGQQVQWQHQGRTPVKLVLVLRRAESLHLTMLVYVLLCW